MNGAEEEMPQAFRQACLNKLNEKGIPVNRATLEEAYDQLYELFVRKGEYTRRRLPHNLQYLKDHVEFRRAVDQEAALNGYNLEGFWDTDGVPE
jgi:hypothetical protein